MFVTPVVGEFSRPTFGTKLRVNDANCCPLDRVYATLAEVHAPPYMLQLSLSMDSCMIGEFIHNTLAQPIHIPKGEYAWVTLLFDLIASSR